MPVDEATEVKDLEEQVLVKAPARGTQPFTESSRERQPFTALPLSQRTIHGLSDGGFKTMTEIQVRTERTCGVCLCCARPVSFHQGGGCWERGVCILLREFNSRLHLMMLASVWSARETIDINCDNT